MLSNEYLMKYSYAKVAFSFDGLQQMPVFEAHLIN